MAGPEMCAVCGKQMEPKECGHFHIKNKVTKAEKHAHAQCVQREHAKAKEQGF